MSDPYNFVITMVLLVIFGLVVWGAIRTPIEYDEHYPWQPGEYSTGGYVQYPLDGYLLYKEDTEIFLPGVTIDSDFIPDKEADNVLSG